MSSEDDIKRFAKTYEITFPVGKDNDIGVALRVLGIPETVFIAPGGWIAGRHKGPIEYEELVEKINRINLAPTSGHIP